MDKVHHTAQLVADGEVGVQDVEESVLVGFIFPHEEEVDGESDKDDEEKNDHDDDYDHILNILPRSFQIGVHLRLYKVILYVTIDNIVLMNESMKN